MEVAVSELLYNNYLTQFDCYSSNVIAKLQTSGKLVHLTSFDFDQRKQNKRPLYQASFYRGSNHLFDSIMLYGDVGVYTGIRMGQYSVAQNQLVKNERTEMVDLIQNLMYIGYPSTSMALREAL